MLADVLDDGPDDLVEADRGWKPISAWTLEMSGTRRGMSSKPGLVRLAVGDEHDRRAVPVSALTRSASSAIGDLLGVADVEHLRRRRRLVHQLDQGADHVADVAEAAGLRAVAVDGDRLRPPAPAGRRSAAPCRTARSAAGRRC